MTTKVRSRKRTKPATLTLSEAITAWVDALTVASLSNITQLRPGEVLSALQDIRIDAQTRQLPKNLSELLKEAKRRVDAAESGREAPINFIVTSLLRTAGDDLRRVL